MRESIVRELVEAVKKIAGEGYLVEKTEVKKNNGVNLQAVIVREQGEVVSPTIYVDRFVDEIEGKDMTVTEVAQKVFDIYQEHKNPEMNIDIKNLSNKEYILENVEYQLVNAERNVERFRDIPGKKIADLVAIYRVVVNNDGNGIASYILSNAQLKISKISIEELDEAAMRNTQRGGFITMTMAEVMAEMMQITEEMAVDMPNEPQMYVLTNSRRVNGANILLYKDQLEKVADRTQGDFYILPSSIHELLAIPASAVDDVKYLKNMVREVNDTQLAQEEILGYEVYRYNSRTGEIEVAT